MHKKLKNIILFIVLVTAVVNTSAQAVLKVGGNPTTVNKGTALDLESTTKGFLPPRMTKAQRNAIILPPAGLQVWCTDCNTLTNPSSAELSIYSGKGWAPLSLVTTPKLTTGKKADANAPVRLSATSANINGVLVSFVDAAPTETGIVWKEITGDFGVFPVLDDNSTATVPVYKTVGPLVNTIGGAISVTVPSLNSTSSYYFRTYGKNSAGIGYGNPVIFSCTPPSVNTPVVTYQAGGTPTFAGTLTVNAGTPQNSITEYGYYSSTTNPPTTNKVVLSTAASLAVFNKTLDSETFTTNPKLDLTVNNYTVVTSGTSYFRYYVIANAATIYSDVVVFDPAGDVITGGTAVATISSIDPISPTLKAGAVSSSSITVHLNVTKAGTYGDFTASAATGATTGLTMASITGGNFTVGPQTLTFFVNGTPATSLDGNSFTVSRLGTLTTGAIQGSTITSGDAICDGVHLTTVVPITSSTKKIWMDRNLGASRKATAIDDYQAYGCLFQWGRGNDDHASIKWVSSTNGTPVNNTTNILSNTDNPGTNLFIVSIANSQFFYDWRSPQNNMLWQGVSGINNPCPSLYRLPTQTELNDEVTAYSMTSGAAAYNSIYKFVLPGARVDASGSLDNYAGQRAEYWSSTTIKDPTPNNAGFDAVQLSFYNFLNSTGFGTSYRAFGFSVRCIKD